MEGIFNLSPEAMIMFSTFILCSVLFLYSKIQSSESQNGTRTNSNNECLSHKDLIKSLEKEFTEMKQEHIKKKKEDRLLKSSFTRMEDQITFAEDSLILSPKKASKLKTEAIQKLIQENFKEYNKAIENLNNIKYEIIKEEQNHMTEDAIERIKEAITSLKNTISRIKDVADEHLIQESNTRLSLSSLCQPEFHGNNEPHFFKFKRDFINYLKTAKVPLSDSTPLLLKSIQGTAKNCLTQNNIKDSYMGDHQKIMNILRINFGEPDRIVKTISNQLEAYGELPGLYSNVSWSQIVEETQKIIGLIENIQILEQESLLRKSDYLHLEEVCLKIVPREHFNKLQLQIENNEDLLASFTSLLGQNKDQAYKKLWKECYEEEETLIKEEQKHFTYTIKEDKITSNKKGFGLELRVMASNLVSSAQCSKTNSQSWHMEFIDFSQNLQWRRKVVQF